MTAPTAPAPPLAPTTPPASLRPNHRDRMRARYTAAVDERIDKARAAAVQLSQADTVPWADTRAIYARPERTPWQSYKAAARQVTRPAFTLTLLMGFVGIVLLSLVLGNMKGQAAEAARKAAPAGTAPVVNEVLTRQQELTIVAAFGGGLLFVFGNSVQSRVSTRRKRLADGYMRDGDEVVTEALNALPALAAVASAPVGRLRAAALTDAHAKMSVFMTAVTDSTDSAAGITGYAGDRSRLKEHGKKVRTAFADRLGGLVEEREDTARQVAGMVLTVAARHAQAAYGTLLDAGDLPAEPGPEVADLRGIRKVLGGAALAALVVLALAAYSGADLAASVALSLGVFAVVAFLGAVYTGRLHEVGRAFSIFNRHGGGPSGGVV